MNCEIDNKIITSNKAPSELLPPRSSEGHKGTFGKVLLIVGSRNMAGAAILAARAAYRSGSGMVKIISPECNREIIQISVPEALYMPAEADNYEWEKAFDWCDVVGIGSGLGRDELAIQSLTKVWTMTDKPLLIDGDAINLLPIGDVMTYISVLSNNDGRKIVYTPHLAELSKLYQSVKAYTSTMTSDVDNDKDIDIAYLNGGVQDSRNHRNSEQLPMANICSFWLKSVIAAKSADTYVVDASDIYSGGDIFLNDRGNSGMATAGSGDVLAGCITSMMGQGLDPWKAAVTGVQLHAIAGDKAALSHSEAWVMAGDICDNIGLDIEK